MTTSTQVDSTTGERARDRSPVVVAVDGSERNKAAVAWAATEAARVGTDLLLVTVVEEGTIPHHLSTHHVQEHARTMLDAVVAEVTPVVGAAHVESRVVAGHPDDVLVAAAADARTLVLGKRGLGALPRLIVGSTSLAVAGRAAVPVAVVPDVWKQEDHDHRPVVVGVDPYRAHDRLLRLGFERAGRLGVPLVAVHGWETPAATMWGTTSMAGATAPAIAEWEQEAHDEFDKVLNSWRPRYPDVETRGVLSHLHPAMAVLDAGGDAQLVLLGRHTSHRVSGFAFGSVTRAVLHYSTCPVLVVPSDEG